MAKMTVEELKPMLASQKYDALAAMSDARLAGERADAMDYYLGNMAKDMPAQDGRSKAVSTDVADTIEGMLPLLMEEVAGSDEVVRFEPVGPEDEEAAQQETDTINHVLMQQNPGWKVIYSFTKDGLLQKVGIAKVWWEENEQEERETCYGLTDEQYQALAYAVQLSDGAMKIIEHSVNGDEEAGEAPEPKEEAAY